MKKKKITAIASIFAIILLAIAIIGLFHSCDDENLQANGGMILDSAAESYDPKVDITTNSDDGIAIPGYGTIYFPENETDIQITLYNPKKNTCLFKFELYIDDEATPIATTDLVEPGKAVQNVKLERPLKIGEYKLNIKVLTYAADTYTPLNNALVYADLYVLANE